MKSTAFNNGLTEDLMNAVRGVLNETTEKSQLDELSKKTLQSYAKKESDDGYQNYKKAGKVSSQGNKKASDYYFSKAIKRHDGVGLAKSKIRGKDYKDKDGYVYSSKIKANEDVELTLEDFEQLTREEKEEFLNKKLNEIEKDSYVTHKKSGAVGRVTGVSGDRSSVDIEWNDKNSKHHPSQPIDRVEKEEFLNKKLNEIEKGN